MEGALGQDLQALGRMRVGLRWQGDAEGGDQSDSARWRTSCATAKKARVFEDEAALSAERRVRRKRRRRRRRRRKRRRRRTKGHRSSFSLLFLSQCFPVFSRRVVALL